MATHSRAVAVGYVLLAAVSVVVIDLRLALIPAACASIALLVGGLAVFRRWRIALTIPWPSVKEEIEPQGVVIIDGRPCPFQGYEQNRPDEGSPPARTSGLLCPGSNCPLRDDSRSNQLEWSQRSTRQLL